MCVFSLIQTAFTESVDIAPMPVLIHQLYHFENYPSHVFLLKYSGYLLLNTISSVCGGGGCCSSFIFIKNQRQTMQYKESQLDLK